MGSEMCIRDSGHHPAGRLAPSGRRGPHQHPQYAGCELAVAAHPAAHPSPQCPHRRADRAVPPRTGRGTLSFPHSPLHPDSSSAPPASPLSERRWGAAVFCVFSEILTQHFFGAFTGASSLYFSVFPSVSLDFYALVSQIPFRFCFCALLLFFGSYAIIQIV